MKSTIQLYTDLLQLQVTTKKSEKEALLHSFKERNHHTTISVLRILNNPMITTGIAQKKLAKSLSCDASVNLINCDLPFVLTYLSKHNTGTDALIKSVQNYLASLPEKYQGFAASIITKSFKVGVTAKTLNKIYGDDFIPIFALQLSQSYNKYKHNLIDGKIEIALTIKYDGHRTATLSESQQMFTRTGRPLMGVVDVLSEIEQLQMRIKQLLPESNYLIDGELLVLNSDKPKEDWFNETTKILRSNGEKHNIAYHIFDIVPYNEFLTGKSTANYKERRNILEQLFKHSNFTYLQLAPLLYFGTDHSNISKYYEEAINNSEEGIMINLNEPYFCKRTNTLLKVKPVLSADLEIIGFEQGDKYSKYENTLGALIVDFDGTPVGVGSGLTDDIRDEIWNNRNKYLGCIAEIGYTSVSKNQNNDTLNLRFPRFKTIRNDKTVDDINIEY